MKKRRKRRRDRKEGRKRKGGGEKGGRQKKERIKGEGDASPGIVPGRTFSVVGQTAEISPQAYVARTMMITDIKSQISVDMNGEWLRSLHSLCQ